MILVNKDKIKNTTIHEDKLNLWAKYNNYRLVWGAANILEQVKSDIREKLEKGQINSDFFRANIDYLLITTKSNEFSSILIVAVPKEAKLLSFHHNRGIIEAIIPPTYHHYRRTTDLICDQLSALLGTQLKPLNAPLKLIAAKLGLTKYGRNNLSYVPGLGSYFQLVGCILNKDFKIKKTENDGIETMPQCLSCKICLTVCPTKAITEDNFLIDHKRCLTYLNEYPGSWPLWLFKNSHHCLIGCLRCQEFCPANLDKLIYDRIDIEFSKTETNFILDGWDGQAKCSLSNQIRNKLSEIDLVSFNSILSRNLQAILK